MKDAGSRLHEGVGPWRFPAPQKHVSRHPGFVTSHRQHPGGQLFGVRSNAWTQRKPPMTYGLLDLYWLKNLSSNFFKMTRWWFQILLEFSPLFGEDSYFD